MGAAVGAAVGLEVGAAVGTTVGYEVRPEVEGGGRAYEIDLAIARHIDSMVEKLNTANLKRVKTGPLRGYRETRYAPRVTVR